MHHDFVSSQFLPNLKDVKSLLPLTREQEECPDIPVALRPSLSQWKFAGEGRE